MSIVLSSAPAHLREFFAGLFSWTGRLELWCTKHKHDHVMTSQHRIAKQVDELYEQRKKLIEMWKRVPRFKADKIRPNNPDSVAKFIYIVLPDVSVMRSIEAIMSAGKKVKTSSVPLTSSEWDVLRNEIESYMTKDTKPRERIYPNRADLLSAFAQPVSK
ncbi:MAG: hypothetical protein MMC23_000464 [Stictis urceolatum]|nr:hypothetical protein [Stictis urceolata]